MLNVYDPSLVVTALEYRAKEGLDLGDTLDATWQTAWSGGAGTGTPGTDEVLARSHELTVQGGLGAEFLWRVAITDRDGVTRYISDSFSPQNLESEEKVIAVDYLVMVHRRGNPSDTAGDIAQSTSYAYPTETDVGGVVWLGTVQPLPVGAEITKFRARMASLSVSGVPIRNCFIRLVVVDAADLRTQISSTLLWQEEGASWKEDTTIGHVVQEEEAFHVWADFQLQDTVEDQRFYKAEITYLTPAYRFNL